MDHTPPTKGDLAVLADEVHSELVHEFANIAGNINNLRTELRTNVEALRANIDALRVEMHALTGMIRPLAEALARWPDLFASLADRVRRLEEK